MGRVIEAPVRAAARPRAGLLEVVVWPLLLRLSWVFRAGREVVLGGLLTCVAAVLAGSWHVSVGWAVGLVCVVLGGLLVRQSGGVRVYLQRAGERYRAVRLDHQWPQVAVELAWDQAYGDGRRRVPELLKVERPTSGELRLVFRPLAQHGREKWPVMADQLRRQLGAAVCRWREARPGVLEVALSFEPLPSYVPFPSAALGRRWDDFRLGRQAGGGEAVWRPSDIPGLIISGVPKGGKSNLVRVLLVQALRSGWHVAVANPRREGGYRWAGRLGVPVVADLPDVLELVRELAAEMRRRSHVLEAEGVTTWESLRPRPWHPWLLVVDDAPVLLLVNRADKASVALQEELGTLLARISAEGRGVGVHLVVGIQRPDVQLLGPAGGLLRNNIEGRVAVCSLDDEGLRMMFGASKLDPDIKGGLNGTKGRALVSALSAGDVDVYQTQLYALAEEDVGRLGVEPTIPQGLPS